MTLPPSDVLVTWRVEGRDVVLVGAHGTVLVVRAGDVLPLFDFLVDHQLLVVAPDIAAVEASRSAADPSRGARGTVIVPLPELRRRRLVVVEATDVEVDFELVPDGRARPWTDETAETVDEPTPPDRPPPGKPTR